MSFKSKQRAKHGHLFGDDPLNATLVSASDDPLFSPASVKKTSQSTRTTNSPVVISDPLLSPRSSSPSTVHSPLDASNSTPIRHHAKTNSSSSSSNNGSIFGDIDVSKLGLGISGTSNNKRVGSSASSSSSSSRPLRSSTTLRASNVEDEEDLFSGGYTRKAKPINKTATPSTTVSPPLQQHYNTRLPADNTSSTSPIIKTSPSVITPQLQQQQARDEITHNANKNTISTKVTNEQAIENKNNIPEASEEEKPTKAATGERPTSSSFFASATRFFKSSSSNAKSSKTSSSASSIASVNNTDPLVSSTSSNSIIQSSKQEEETITTPQPPVLHQPAPIHRNQFIDNNRQQEEIEEEEEEADNPIIEDEATRAFANDVLVFQSKPDYYPSISPDIFSSTFDTMLTFSSSDPKRPVTSLVPSSSTPTQSTTSTLDVDPWSDPMINSTLALKASITNNKTVPTQNRFLGGSMVEPSVSSPIMKKISMRDIEPQKRSAFADLISSWNNSGQESCQVEVINSHVTDESASEDFFSHIAEEQSDVGFAGIEAVDEQVESYNNRRSVSHTITAWGNTEAELNPWN